LKTVLQLLKSDSQLSAYFVRHGIQDTIKEFTLKSKIDEMNALGDDSKA
jgi:hypothetical protein